MQLIEGEPHTAYSRNFLKRNGCDRDVKKKEKSRCQEKKTKRSRESEDGKLALEDDKGGRRK